MPTDDASIRSVYLDCNATTPIDPRVAEVVIHYMTVEFGNAGSTSHEYGARAKQAVERARDAVAAVVGASRDEVIFTSGATESNNLAFLGLASHGDDAGRKHIVSTKIEHKAVLEPLAHLAERGFEVTLVPPNRGGWVEPDAVRAALRPDTLLVSVMHVNNETGVIQPLDEIAGVLGEHPAYLHTDAAQGFGKELRLLRNPRIDLISVSGHKLYAPKGIGVLVTRRREFKRPPLKPLMYGGGQERGLRPGTLPVHLIAGLGKAAELACTEHVTRAEVCRTLKQELLTALADLRPTINGDPERTLPHVVNLSFPGLDSDAAMVALKDYVALSNGSACTSASYEPSHVLRAMFLPEDLASAALRWSWSHLTTQPVLASLAKAIHALR